MLGGKESSKCTLMFLLVVVHSTCGLKLSEMFWKLYIDDRLLSTALPTLDGCTMLAWIIMKAGEQQVAIGSSKEEVFRNIFYRLYLLLP